MGWWEDSVSVQFDDSVSTKQWAEGKFQNDNSS